MEKKFDALLAWFERNGGFHSGLRINNRNGYRSLNSTRQIEKGEIIFKAPLNLCFFNSDSEMSELKEQFGNQKKLPQQLYLSIKLLQENENPNSFWRPFLDVLPSTFPGLARDLNQEQREFLKDTIAGKYILKYNSLVEDFQQLIKSGSNGRWSEQEITWSHDIVLTRAFSGRGIKQKSSTLIPIIEMCNHAKKTNLTHEFNPEKSYFSISAIEDIEENEELIFSYSPKSNNHLFSTYGFTLPDILEKEAYLPIGEYLESRLEADIKRGNINHQFHTVESGKASTFHTLLSRIRSLCDKGFPFSKPTANQFYSNRTHFEFSKPRDFYNEIQTLSAVIELCSMRKSWIEERRMVITSRSSDSQKTKDDSYHHEILVLFKDELSLISQITDLSHSVLHFLTQFESDSDLDIDYLDKFKYEVLSASYISDIYSWLMSGTSERAAQMRAARVGRFVSKGNR